MWTQFTMVVFAFAAAAVMFALCAVAREGFQSAMSTRNANYPKIEEKVGQIDPTQEKLVLELVKISHEESKQRDEILLGSIDALTSAALWMLLFASIFLFSLVSQILLNRAERKNKTSMSEQDAGGKRE